MGQLYTVKTAAPRWQREYAQLSPEDVDRLGIRSAPKSRFDIELARRKLFDFGTDLTPTQIERHRRLNRLMANQVRENHFVVGDGLRHGDSGYAAGAHGVVAPTVDGGKRFVDDQYRQIAGRARVDHYGTTDRSLLNHELAEEAMGAGARNADPKRMRDFTGSPADRPLPSHARLPRAAGTVPSRARYLPAPFSTHFGSGANLAEVETLFRDPDAYRLFDTMKRVNDDPEERAYYGKAKQYGATPSRPLPVGGKAHYKLDQWIKNGPISNPAGGWHPIHDGATSRLQIGGMSAPGAKPSDLRREFTAAFSAMRPDALVAKTPRNPWRNWRSVFDPARLRPATARLTPKPFR